MRFSTIAVAFFLNASSSSGKYLKRKAETPVEVVHWHRMILEQNATAFEPVAFNAEEPSASIAEEPAASVTEEPTASIAEEPAASVTEEPAASVTEEPAASIAEEPAASVSEEPAASVAEEPAASVTEEPAASIAEEPAASIAEEPEASIAEEPAASIAEESVALIGEEPAASVADEPAASVAEEPAASIAKEPAASVTAEPEAFIAEELEPVYETELSADEPDHNAACAAEISKLMNIPEVAESFDAYYESHCKAADNGDLYTLDCEMGEVVATASQMCENNGGRFFVGNFKMACDDVVTKKYTSTAVCMGDSCDLTNGFKVPAKNDCHIVMDWSP